mmetsp:Transcript_24918/g.73687  ORF Transcript_24918/g.73687 Transcript_24918/m.73687 type:complete len:261 (+) Transcript_24918:1489-2271(+)
MEWLWPLAMRATVLVASVPFTCLGVGCGSYTMAMDESLELYAWSDPSPSCPYCGLPAAIAEPAAIHTVKSIPADTAVAAATIALTGDSCRSSNPLGPLRMLPTPSCPIWFDPNENASPSLVMTAEWLRPPAPPTTTLPVRPSTSLGELRCTRSPCPSWPFSFRPHVKSRPSMSPAMTCTAAAPPATNAIRTPEKAFSLCGSGRLGYSFSRSISALGSFLICLPPLRPSMAQSVPPAYSSSQPTDSLSFASIAIASYSVCV